MALFNRASKSGEGDTKLYTEDEARVAFDPAVEVADLETIVARCSKLGLSSLAKSLHDCGVTAEQTDTVLADARDV